MSSSALADLLRQSVDSAHRAIHSASNPQHAAACLAQLIAADVQQQQQQQTTQPQPQPSTSQQQQQQQHWQTVVCTLLQCAPSHAWCADAALRVVRDVCEVHGAAFLAAVLDAAPRHVRLAEHVVHAARELALADVAAPDAASRLRAAPLLAALVRRTDSRSSLRALVAMAEADAHAPCRQLALSLLPLSRSLHALDAAVRVACSDHHSAVRAVVYARLAADAAAAPSASASSAHNLSSASLLDAAAAAAPGPVLALLTVAERRALLDAGFRQRNGDPVHSECLAMLRAWSLCDVERGVLRAVPSLLAALRLLGDLSECERLARTVVDALMHQNVDIVPRFHGAPFATEELVVWRHVCAALESEKNASLSANIAELFHLPQVDVVGRMLEPWARLERLDVFPLRQLLGCVAPLVGLARATAQQKARTVIALDDDDETDSGRGGGGGGGGGGGELAARIAKCRATVMTIVKRPQFADAFEEALTALWMLDESIEQRLTALVELISHLTDDEHDEPCCGDHAQRWLLACRIGLFCLQRCDRRRAITDSLTKLALSAIKHVSAPVRLSGVEIMPHLERIRTVPYEFLVPSLQVVALSDTDAVRARALTGCVDIYLRNVAARHKRAAPFGGAHMLGDDLLESDAALFDMRTAQYRCVHALPCAQLAAAVTSGVEVDVQAVLGSVLREIVVDLDGTLEVELKFAVYASLVALPHHDDVGRNAVLLLALFDADVCDARHAAAAAELRKLLRAWAQDRAQWVRLAGNVAALVAVARVLQRSQCFVERSPLLAEAAHASNVEQLLRHLQFLTGAAVNAPLWLGLAALISRASADDAALVRTLLRCIDITPPHTDDEQSAAAAAASRAAWLAPFLAIVDDTGDTDLAAYVRALEHGGGDQSFAAWLDASGTSRKRKQVTELLRAKRVSFGDPSPAATATLVADSQMMRSQDVFSPPHRQLTTTATATLTTTATLDLDDGVIVPDTPLSASQQLLQQQQQHQHQQQDSFTDVAGMSSPSSRSFEAGENAARRLSRSSSTSRRLRRRSSILPTLVVPATVEVIDDDDDDAADERTQPPALRAAVRDESDTTLAPTQVVPPTQVAPPTSTIDVDSSDDADERTHEPPVEVLPPTLVVDNNSDVDDDALTVVDDVRASPPPKPIAVEPIVVEPIVAEPIVVEPVAAEPPSLSPSPSPPPRVEHFDDGGGFDDWLEPLPPVAAAALSASPVCTQRPSPAAAAVPAVGQIAMTSQSHVAIRFDDLLRGFQSGNDASSVASAKPVAAVPSVDDLDARVDGFAVRNKSRRFAVAYGKKRAVVAPVVAPVVAAAAAAATSEQSTSTAVNSKSAIRAAAFVYVTPAAQREWPLEQAAREKMARELNVYFLPDRKRSHATHVIVPTSGDRTLFTLCAALRHAWLVPARWLTQSYDAGALLPERFFGTRFVGEPFKGQRVWCEPALLDVGADNGFPASHFETLVRCGNGTTARSKRDADVLLLLDDGAAAGAKADDSGENRRANRAAKHQERVVVAELFAQLQPEPQQQIK